MTAAAPPWLDLATRALCHQLAGRDDIAQRCARRLLTVHGPDVAEAVIIAWCDAVVTEDWPLGRRPSWDAVVALAVFLATAKHAAAVAR
jgi:hypothetical protein